MSMLLKPVLILAHPDDHTMHQVVQLCEYAQQQQRVPIPIHPSVLPWYDAREKDDNNHVPACYNCGDMPMPKAADMHPAAQEAARTMLHMVATHTGGRLWILLRPGEESGLRTYTSPTGAQLGSPWPDWTLGTIRAWQSWAGRMPARIRAGDPSVWASFRVPVAQANA